MSIDRVARGLDLGRAMKSNSSKTAADFADMFQAALSHVNNLQVRANQLSEGFALGLNDNVQEVMLAMQEAQLALQLTVQIRNKLTEAYQELMRMQI